MEEPSILDASVKSNLPDRQSIQPAVDRQSIQPTLQDTTHPQDLLVNTFTEEVPQPQLDVSEPQLPQPQFDQYEDPPSIAPFSVPPPSVPPPSVPPQAEVPVSIVYHTIIVGYYYCEF